MKFRKLLVALSISAALVVAGCGQSSPKADTDKVFEIGVLNLVSHPALDAVQKGFVDGLAAAGYADGGKVKLELQNAQGDSATATTIAAKFAQAKKDLVLAIATPAAQAVAQAITDKPVLFGAVTDPVAAELVASWEKPGRNITGASDMNPVEDQLKLIKEVAPNVKTIGIVYSSGEINSEVQVKAAEKFAAELGFTIVKATVANSAEVQQAAESLTADAFFVPTDNTVVSGIAAMVQISEKRKIPIFGSDEGPVAGGAVAALSVNYEQQGKDLAEMAIQILKGEKQPADMPVLLQKKFDLIINPAAAKRIGLEIPEAVTKRAAKTL